MKQLSWMVLLLGTAMGLTAQTLSFGEITLVTPATTPPTYTVNVILTTSGTAAGAQFDLNYDPTQLTVTVGLGSSATAVSKELSTICLGQALPGCSQPAQNNPSTKATINNGPGWRAIIAGVSLADSSTGTVGAGGPTLIADGPVATLTIQPTSTGAPTGTTGQKITFLNQVATTAGNGQTAPSQITLAIGAGSSDPGATGVLDMYHTYLVGGVYTSGGAYPPATIEAPGFGTGKLTINDVILILLVQTSAPGYTLPAACSDLFDAMDTFPLDTPTTRGGDGKIKITDVINALEMQTNAPTFNVRIIRPTRNACTQGTSMTANSRQPVVEPPVEVQGTVVLGAAAGVGTPQERVPVYLQAGRNLTRTAVAFSLGDQQSQLQFEAAPGVAPSLSYNSQPGFVAVAWLKGLDVRAGERLLLGYVVGPSGSAANLRVFGTTAAGLDNKQEIGLDVSVAR